MQNEIELKIMLSPENIEPMKNWLAQQNVMEQHIDTLGNTYFDTKEQYFAQNKMGFRVRSYNGQHQMTLKMKGEIVGGLHIRPEYNLDLPSATPDFKRLNTHFNLQIPDAERISNQLEMQFSTDFVRQKWLIQQRNTKIEVALDQGEIRNKRGSAAICEIEFELLAGELADVFALLAQMPKHDGMWFSGLSKAQRGYLIGDAARFTAEIEAALGRETGYILEQKLADYLREMLPSQELCAGVITALYQQCPAFPHQESATLQHYLKSAAYLQYNLTQLLALSK